MRYEITGNVLPSVDIYLESGESVYTESGGMAWMTGQVEMDTSTRGGLLKGLSRKLSGESLFMISYRAQGGPGMVTFAPKVPGRIMVFELGAGQSLICQRDAFLVAEESVDVDIHFRKRLGAGFFGGEGFILQKITGPGAVFLEIDGDVREYTLGSGERMDVNPGYIAFYEPTVDHNIRSVRGLKNVLFAGEGFFLATLEGPGKVWLQSMTIPSLARTILKHLPGKSS